MNRLIHTIFKKKPQSSLICYISFLLCTKWEAHSFWYLINPHGFREDESLAKEQWKHYELGNTAAWHLVKRLLRALTWPKLLSVFSKRPGWNIWLTAKHAPEDRHSQMTHKRTKSWIWGLLVPFLTYWSGWLSVHFTQPESLGAECRSWSPFLVDRAATSGRLHFCRGVGCFSFGREAGWPSNV